MEKHKKFEMLSLSQRRKRLHRMHNSMDPANHPNQYSDDSESSSGEERFTDSPPISPPPYPAENQSNGSVDGSEDVPENDSETESLSSNQGFDDEEWIDDIPVDDAVEQMDIENMSDSSEDDDANNQVPPNPVELQKKALKNAFLEANLKHNQGNIMLKILRDFPFNMIHLPKDSRTILQTPNVEASRFVRRIGNGEYLHIGFKKTLRKKLESLPENILPDTIVIDFSTDGAKVYKGGDEFWPHQYRITNIPDKRPMIAGIFKGRGKPSNAFEFFEEFVDEILEVQREGINIRNNSISLEIRCFIADAPARAMALNHYGHMSSNPCSKCKVEGHHSTTPGFDRTMIFPGIRHPSRTDEQYHNLDDEDHHKGRSPLAPLLLLVTKVPFDGMHLVWLGNCKKVVVAQVDGKWGLTRLNGRKLKILDSRMTMLSEYCPSEFNRRPRNITMFHSYKATEFRQLLLYTAPAVFKDIFDLEYYQHFMILHHAMRILVSEESSEAMYDYCQHALEGYVLMAEQLYGDQFLSYNVHGLLHLVDDVRELGPLESFSAFCYENHLPELRKRIRKPGLCLQQMYKRLGEMNDSTFTALDHNIVIRPSLSHARGPLPENIPANLCQQFYKLEVGKCTFATSLRDSCCVLQDSRICLIENIIRVQREIFLIVREFRRKSELYNVGMTSDTVGLYRCSSLSPIMEAVHLPDVKNKCYRMPEWSNVLGEEENVIEDQWICVNLLTPLEFPRN